MSLSTLRVQSGTVLAKSVSTIAKSPFILRYVAARRARAIVVMNAICGWFRSFIDGIEIGCCWHGIASRGSYISS
jgi:hypothetical protein